MKPLLIITLTTLLGLAGCDRSGPAPEPTGGPDTGSKPKAAKVGVDINASVRQNLGITFVTVERRAVRRTVRVPGEFELRPDARRDYHAMLPGRIDLKVNQYDRVKAGDLLATIDSPEWARMRHAVVEAEGEIRLAEAAIEVARTKLDEIEKQIEFSQRRADTLKGAGTRDIALESRIDELRNTLPRLGAELNARRVDLDEANEHFESQLNVMSSLTGITTEHLKSTNGEDDPVWRSRLAVEVRAEAEGIVDKVAATSGGWVEPGTMMLSTADPAAIRFHGHAPQSDLARFATGQPGSVVPPDGGTLADAKPIDGNIRVGFRGHPDERTVPIYLQVGDWPAWAKPGVGAYLEIVVDGDAKPEPAIPERAIVTDGIQRIFFVRDRKNPDRALPVKADLGVSDGRYVEVLSGVTDGDEIVVEGAYALKLATTDRPAAPEGYHYHADGSLHKDH